MLYATIIIFCAATGHVSFSYYEAAKRRRLLASRKAQKERRDKSA